MSGLGAEIRRSWQRTWAGRLMPLLLAATVLLLVAVRVVAPAPAGAVHSELARLLGANEIIGFALTIAAILSAYRLIAPDLNEEFESLSLRGQSSLFNFAAGRALVGVGDLLLTATVLGLAVDALDAGGRYQREEALHVAFLLVNAVPLLMLAMVLTCGFGRIVGVIASVVLLNVGADAAYQRAALADGFIAQSPLFSLEQFFAWLMPRPMIDPLLGIALIDHSVALQQFPIREGNGVWGWDLIQVSGSGDIAAYTLYMLALAALLYFVCWRRAVQARSRFGAVPSWLGAQRVDHSE